MSSSINPAVEENHQKEQLYSLQLKQKIAYLILITSLLIFMLTLLGFTDSLSDKVNKLLFDNLGYTNKWSKSYGPREFLYINYDISSLAGPVLLTIFIFLMTIFYFLKGRLKELKKFLFVVIGGGVFMMILKVVFAKELPDESVGLIFSTISPYPSGHSMMSVIFFMTLAVIVSRTQRRPKVKIFLIISAASLTIIIGFSRFLTGGHTVTEVIAGWSLGFVWVSVCWLSEQYIKKLKW